MSLALAKNFCDTDSVAELFAIDNLVVYRLDVLPFAELTGLRH